MQILNRNKQKMPDLFKTIFVFRKKKGSEDIKMRHGAHRNRDPTENLHKRSDMKLKTNKDAS